MLGYNNYQNYQHYQNYQTYNIVNQRQMQVDNIPGPNFEILDPCLLIVAKSVCKIRIDTSYGSFGGSGFFLKFLINGKFYYWLVTNEHVITKEMINNKNMISVWFNIENNSINIKLDKSERYIKTFKENKVDATVIQIRSKDNIYQDYFLESELGYDNNNLVGKEIFIPQFPGFQQIKNSRGIIKNISYNSPNEFVHLAKTQKGSSGSPIFLRGNKRVIGIHKEGNQIIKENYGDFIAPIISILTYDIMNIFNKMQINNEQNYNNVSIYSQNSFGLINPNNNSKILVGQKYPNNQIKSVNQINQNMINNNITIPGNLNNFNAINKNNNMNNKINYLNNLTNSLNKPAVNNHGNDKRNLNDLANNKLETQKKSEDEEKYIGQLVNGLRHGKGTVYYKNNGKIKYKGDFVNGNYEGYGELYNENGTIKYKGNFKNNKYDGNIKLYYDNGKIEYEGIFVKGLKQGKGIDIIKTEKLNMKVILKMENFMKEKEKNIMIMIMIIELNMKVILKMVNMKEKEKNIIMIMIIELYIKVILKMGYIKEKYTMKMELLYLKEALKILNMMEKEKNIMIMEKLSMKVIL